MTLTRIVVINTCGMGGITMIGIGLWWVLPWVSLVVVGTILFALSIAGAKS